VLHRTVLYHKTVPQDVTCCTVPRSIVLYRAVQHYAVLYHKLYFLYLARGVDRTPLFLVAWFSSSAAPGVLK
jgi:hypothetical protein